MGENGNNVFHCLLITLAKYLTNLETVKSKKGIRVVLLQFNEDVGGFCANTLLYKSD